MDTEKGFGVTPQDIRSRQVRINKIITGDISVFKADNGYVLVSFKNGVQSVTIKKNINILLSTLREKIEQLED